MKRFVIVHPDLGIFLGVSEMLNLYWSFSGGVKSLTAPTVEAEEDAQHLVSLLKDGSTGLDLSKLTYYPVEGKEQQVTADELRAAGLEQYIGVLSHPAWAQKGGTA